MKVGIIVNHPTQFEGPFFRYAASSGECQLRVIYTNAESIRSVHDSELSRDIEWGIDLMSGYDYCVMPQKGWLRWLVSEIRDGNYDFMVLSGYNSTQYLAAAIVAKFYGVRTGLRIDAVLFNQRSKLKLGIKKLVYKILFQLYAHFFVVGSLSADYLKYFNVSAKKISYFTYAIDDAYFRTKSGLDISEQSSVRSRYGIAEKASVLLSVAKFNDREAPWDLLKAFCSMKNDNYQLLLVGEGPQRGDLEAYAVKHSANVVFAGYVSYPELPFIYAIADVFVHPSRNEPWGVSVAEAMACGLPVITSSNVGAGYDLIERGLNGDVYVSGDVDDLREKLGAAIGIAKKRAYLETNKRILAQWGYAATWKSIVTACKETCDG